MSGYFRDNSWRILSLLLPTHLLVTNAPVVLPTHLLVTNAPVVLPTHLLVTNAPLVLPTHLLVTNAPVVATIVQDFDYHSIKYFVNVYR